jgi:hypothetical protein
MKMIAPLSRYTASMLCCFVLGLGSTRAVPEKFLPDNVIHPLLKPVMGPELIPESRIDPAYPEQWRELHLGARVILQGVVKKNGTVQEIRSLKTDLWVVEGCESGDSTPGKQAAPPQAAHDFQLAASRAVKRWRYHPGQMNDVPVDVYFTIIVDFTPCPKEPGKKTP